MNCTIKCCLNCTNRAVGCHSTCELYKEQKAIWDKTRAEEKERQRQEYVRMKAIMDAQARMTKGRKK
jgi:hypothetical protein